VGGTTPRQAPSRFCARESSNGPHPASTGHPMTHTHSHTKNAPPGPTVVALFPIRVTTRERAKTTTIAMHSPSARDPRDGHAALMAMQADTFRAARPRPDTASIGRASREPDVGCARTQGVHADPALTGRLQTRRGRRRWRGRRRRGLRPYTSRAHAHQVKPLMEGSSSKIAAIVRADAPARRMRSMLVIRRHGPDITVWRRRQTSAFRSRRLR